MTSSVSADDTYPSSLVIHVELAAVLPPNCRQLTLQLPPVHRVSLPPNTMYHQPPRHVSLVNAQHRMPEALEHGSEEILNEITAFDQAVVHVDYRTLRRELLVLQGR